MFEFFLKRVLKIKDEKIFKLVKSNLKSFFQDMIIPNKINLILALTFMAIFAAANASLAWLIKPIVNQVFIIQDMNYIYQIAIMIMVVSIVKSVSQYSFGIFLFKVSTFVILKARQTIYNSFLRQDLAFFHKNSPGSLVSAMMNEINAINALATQVPINFGRDFLSFIGLLALMFYQEPLYASFIFISIFVVIIPIKLIGKKVKKYFIQGTQGISNLTSGLEQSLNTIKEVKSYSNEEYEKKKFNNITNYLAHISMKSQRTGSMLGPFMEILGGVSIAGIMIFAGNQVIKGHTDPGTFFSFVAALLLAYQPLKRLSGFFVTIQVGILSLGRYYKFLDCIPTIKDKKNAKILHTKEINLEFKNVSFYYKEDPNDIRPINFLEEPLDSKKEEAKLSNIILQDINFKINKGQKFALVGRSGGGKSTIINLIPRFYDISQGEILINGINLKDYNIKSLRNNIANVNQDIAIFNDSIFNNIAYSKLDATKEEVIQATKKAACYDFIQELPQKFETVVGPRGVMLSGGQKQRISIARALLKDAPLLLLDEATASLDTESEKEIQNSINELMENRTTIIIAHRLSTILYCDNILVIDGGKIVEQGTHQELLKQNGIYRDLYNLQFKDQNEQE